MTAIIIIIIIVLFCIPFVLALFVKKDYNVVRTIVIDRSVGLVYNYIKYIKNQDYYSKWNMSDPNSKKTYSGEDGTVGFVYTWDSKLKNTGAGEQEIVRVNENDRIGTEVRFERPFKNVAHGYMITESVSDHSTKVTWGIAGKNKYPMNIMNLFIDGMLGNDMQESLGNLKRLLEK